jgi:hypothetical protein
MDVAGAEMFVPGERYRLPSGKSVEVLKIRGEYVSCRYLADGELLHAGKSLMNEVMLKPGFLAAFGERE